MTKRVIVVQVLIALDVKYARKGITPNAADPIRRYLRHKFTVVSTNHVVGMTNIAQSVASDTTYRQRPRITVVAHANISCMACPSFSTDATLLAFLSHGLVSFCTLLPKYAEQMPQE